ncbi:unnamed protein product [Brachionus calyciflorus]|uniref:Integrase zinc-binding domain-containing protein n=1 Tax=Brachionus calyciflorus TaxID=104777 RepID=A0A813UH28_9BILA|nr:unnamed protein product [Brachionus calyciflorus]
MIVKKSLPDALTIDLILKATKEDKSLINLSKMIESSNYIKNEDRKIYENVFAELSLSFEGLILRGTRVVLPSSLHKQAIEIAHEGHQGFTKTIQLLRSCLWFPKMDSITLDYYRQCSCQALINTHNKTPIITSDCPDSPWTKISFDFFGPIFPNKIVIDRLNRLCSIFGIPLEVRTDNGPPFNIAKFEDSLLATSEWSSRTDRLTEFLRSYRSTPHESTKVAPKDLLFNNSNTPRLPKLLAHIKGPSLHDMAKANDKYNKLKMKYYADTKIKRFNQHFLIGYQVLVKQKQTNKTYFGEILPNYKTPSEITVTKTKENKFSKVSLIFDGNVNNLNDNQEVNERNNIENRVGPTDIEGVQNDTEITGNDEMSLPEVTELNIEQEIVKINVLAEKLIRFVGERQSESTGHSFEINSNGSINLAPPQEPINTSSVALQATITVFTEKDNENENEIIDNDGPRRSARLAVKTKSQYSFNRAYHKTNDSN